MVDTIELSGKETVPSRSALKKVGEGALWVMAVAGTVAAAVWAARQMGDIGPLFDNPFIDTPAYTDSGPFIDIIQGPIVEPQNGGPVAS